MKFENYEVETEYYSLLKKHGVSHCNFGSTYDSIAMTSEDLIDIESALIEAKKIFDTF